MQPYRVVAKVTNNRLWRAIQTRFPDVTTQGEAARRLACGASELSALLTMRCFPARVVDGRYTYWPRAHRLAALLGAEVEYLFDPTLYAGQVPSRLTVEVGLHALTPRTHRELPPSPHEVAERHERDVRVRDVVQQMLTPREGLVLSRRFGLDGDESTQEQIATDLGISKGRVSQIEARALQKLRHPSRNSRLREVR